MTLKVDIEARQDYLYAAVSGEFTLRAAQAAYDRVVHAALPLAQTRILIDARGVSGNPQPDERYALGVYIANEQRLLAERRPPIHVKVAVLGHQPVVDPQRLGETVAVNRGAKVKVSEQLDEALAWLGISAAAR